MDFDASTYRRDVAIAASGDPQRPAQEGKAVQYLQDQIPALRPAETPWSVADADAPLFMTLLVNATQQKALKEFAALEDGGSARQKVEALSAAQMGRVVEATGAFVPTFLEPKVSRVERKKGYVEMPIALGRDQRAPASAVFASGLNTPAAVTTSFAGNAADNRLAKLLASRIQDERGAVHTVLERLGDSADPFSRALRDLGLEEEAAQAAVQRWATKQGQGLHEVTAIDGDRMKTVFVPDGQGGYYQLSPVPSVAMYTELPRRIRQRQAQGQWVPRSSRVMSSKPQNVGLQVNYQGGRVTRLHGAYRPFDATRYQRRLVALRHGRGGFWTAAMLRGSEDAARLADLFRTLLDAGGEGYVNADIRAGRERRIHHLLDQLLEELREFQAFAAQQELPPELEARTDYAVQVLALGRRGATAEELQAIAREASQVIVQAAVQEGSALSPADAWDDRVYRAVERQAETFVKQELAA